MASLDHEMTVNLDMRPSPAMREFARLIVRETLRQAKDLDLIDNAIESDTFAKELAGRVVKVESTSPSPVHTKVTFADTGEEVPDIRRVEICLDAQTGEMTAALYRWKLSGCEEPTVERATTTSVEVSTVTLVSDTHLENNYDSETR
jgi:hypothetical protein